MKKISSTILKHFQYLLSPTYFDLIDEMFLFGSRKSAKTKSIALRLVIRLMLDRDYNAVAMRKIASELKDSVVSEIQWAINFLGVNHLFLFNKTHKVFTYEPFGNKILCKGIAINPSSGKPSLSGLNIDKGEIKDWWLEECWEFREEDYDMVTQTARASFYTIIFSGNPYFSANWSVKKAVKQLTPILDTLKTKGQMW